MLIQPPLAECPFAKMAICALKISAGSFLLRWSVPASTPLIGNEGKAEHRADTSYEFSISVNGRETVAGGVGGCVESGESVRKGVGGKRELKRGDGCWKGGRR